MLSFRVRVERLVQEAGIVEVVAANAEEAVAAALALTDEELAFERDAEACTPYAYSIQDAATGFDFNLSDARAAGADVGQKAHGAGLETLLAGQLLVMWEAKLLDEIAHTPAPTPPSKSL